MANEQTVRIVLVGCGLIARHHLGALQESGYSFCVCGMVDKNLATAEALTASLPNPSMCKVATIKDIKLCVNLNLKKLLTNSNILCTGI